MKICRQSNIYNTILIIPGDLTIRLNVPDVKNVVVIMVRHYYGSAVTVSALRLCLNLCAFDFNFGFVLRQRIRQTHVTRTFTNNVHVFMC